MKYWTLIVLICTFGAFGCGGDDDDENSDTNVSTNNATTANNSSANNSTAANNTSANNSGGDVTGCCFFNCDDGNGGNWAGAGIGDNAACTTYAQGECSGTVAESEYVDGCTGCNTSCAPDGYLSIPD